MDIRALKEQHGPLYQQTVEGTDFIFRELTLGEFSQIIERDLTPDIADYVLERAIIDPIDKVKDLKIGTSILLADVIIRASQWGDIEKFLGVLEEKRQRVPTMHPAAKAAICSVFNMKPWEVEALRMERFLDLVAETEVVIKQRLYGKDQGQAAQTQRGVPQRGPSRAINWSATHQALVNEGIEPSWNQLLSKMEDETGKTPVPLSVALKNRKRPDENLPSKEIAQHIPWDRDLREFTSPRGATWIDS